MYYDDDDDDDDDNDYDDDDDNDYDDDYGNYTEPHGVTGVFDDTYKGTRLHHSYDRQTPTHPHTPPHF